MKIFDVLSDIEVEKIKSNLAAANWEDGEKSVLGLNTKKKNRQISSRQEEFKLVQPFLAKILSNEEVRSYTFMRRLIDPRVASYQVSGKYDFHVDVALLANDRTDLSFTVFLNDPNSYEGGQLEIQMEGGDQTFKGTAGQIIIYPSGLMHRVTPVTSGERLVLVGWLNSHVKEEQYRVRLYKFRKLILEVAHSVSEDQVEQLTALYYQMVRDYSA